TAASSSMRGHGLPLLTSYRGSSIMWQRPETLPMLLILTAILLMMITLPGCASVSSVPSEYCAIAEPITWAEADTQETLQQIHRHNAKWLCVCEGGCPEGR